jgi:hypothetical protein
MVAMARNPRFTYMVLLTGVSLIAISHLLPPGTQVILANLMRQPIILTVLLIACMIAGYYNLITGLILLLLIVCFVLPMARQPVHEGFKSSTTSKNDISITNPAILNLFDGPLGRALAKQKKESDEFTNIKKAEAKELEYNERKKFKAAKGGDSQEEDDQDETSGDKDEFTDTAKPEKKQTKEKFKTVELRKFNPADNDDMNLLMTMEICDDIKNRIKYVYEDNSYLKKYIREKIEEIVDMLDLVPDN